MARLKLCLMTSSTPAGGALGCTSHGWHVETARVYEMFPGTPHVETVVVLGR